jgi:Planctomycete extracellular
LATIIIGASIMGTLFHQPHCRKLRFEPLEDRRLLSVTGDYNGNSVVDAADYVVWRKSAGLTGTQPADGNGDLVVNDLDYGIWRQHFGETLRPPGAFNIIGPGHSL